MNQKTKLILGIFIFALIVLASSVLYKSLSKNYQPNNGLAAGSNKNSSSESISGNGEDISSENTEEETAAPDFTVVDAVTGNDVKLSDFLGQPVVINFWASWCPPCKQEMPDFDKVYQELGDDVVFMMVNATDGGRETQEKAADFIAEMEYSFPVYYDVSQEASYTYGVSSLPSSLFIDADGYIVTGAMGMIDEETLRKGIAMITEE